MNELNKRDIDRFVELKRINGQSEQTIFHQSRIVTELSDFLKKPFREVTEQDIFSFRILYKYNSPNQSVGRIGNEAFVVLARAYTATNNTSIALVEYSISSISWILENRQLRWIKSEQHEGQTEQNQRD
jgi:hypothetical protein